MNIITADFNWVSFLIVVVGVIAGIVQSNKKKLSSAPVWQEPDFTDEMEEEEKKEEEIVVMEKEPLPGDWFGRQEEPAPSTESQASVEKEEREEYPQIDIRQAIISSEILRRPQF